jgi:hypothetical protein
MRDSDSFIEQIKSRLMESLDSYIKKSEETRSRYSAALKELLSQSSTELQRLIESNQKCEVGLSKEYDEYKELCVPFENRWRNFEEADNWAKDILMERTTFAVDGGQDFFGKELNIPIAIVQIGWFKNPHLLNAGYEKCSELHLIMPDEILGREIKEMPPETFVGQKRFSLEIKKLKDFLESQKDWETSDKRMPVAFFDGAFVVSLARREIQSDIAEQVREVINLSEETKVPVVGYIDRSHAYDLLSLFSIFSNPSSGPTEEKVNRTSSFIEMDDLLILENLNILQKWGDRTIFFYSNRKDLKSFFEDKTFEDKTPPPIGFVYLKTVSDFLPARLDIPSWVFRDGKLKEVLDVVLAECIVSRQGYPYPLCCADQMAFIGRQQREPFIHILQKLISKKNFKLSYSRKVKTKKTFRDF